MDRKKTTGVLQAMAAYGLWGILPIYWKLIDRVFSMEILANRIVWAFVFTVVIVTVTRQWAQVRRILKDRKTMLSICIASILIAFNWGLYIWAVNSDRIVDASLGYYINPLLAVALGVILFKEKLNRWTAAALAIALIGVVIKTVQYGKVPWVSLGLAVSFALYGAMKKTIAVSSILGLTLETAMLVPVAAIYLGMRQAGGQSALGTQPVWVALLLMGAGVVTAIPLLLFASATRRLPLSLIGFTQYISPTLSLLIGVTIYRENFTAVDLTAFCFIWIALGVYTMSQVNLSKNPQRTERISA